MLSRMAIVKPIQQLPAATLPVSDADVVSLGQGALALRKLTLLQLFGYISGKLPVATSGADGRTILNGTAPPVPELGANGDFYLDNTDPTDPVLYGPKGAGAWPAGVPLRGPGAYEVAVANGYSGTEAQWAADVVSNATAVAADKAAADTARDDAQAASANAATSATNAATSAANAAAAAQALIDDTIADTDANAGLFTRSVAKIGALIAAAVATVSRYATTRAALAGNALTGAPCYLAEAGREGWFIFDGSNLSALVTADTAQQGLYVAPASDPTGTSGAWVRKFNGPAISTWWGVSTTATDASNTAAFKAALNTLQALKVLGGYGHGASIGLHTPAGIYNFNAELPIKHALAVTGDYHGQGSGGTLFHWTVSNCHGFHIVKSDGVNDGYGALIRGFVLTSSFATGDAEGEYHAIFQNMKSSVVDVFASNWAGDGVYSLGDTGSDGSNSNGCLFQNIMGQSVRWVVHVQGGDANGSCGYNIQGISARRGAIFDQSFLGNSWDGGWAETCGLEAGCLTRCVYSGNIYVVAYGQEAWCSANAPTGTAAHNQGWLYYQPGAPSATQPTWTAGQTWHFSAPLCSFPGSATCKSPFNGFYIEGNCNPVVLSDCSLITIVNSGAPPVWTSTGTPHGGYFSAFQSMLYTNNGLATTGNVQIGGNSNTFGPQAGAASDLDFYFENCNYHHFLHFRSWAAGVPSIDAAISTTRGVGLYLGGQQTVNFSTTTYGDIAQFYAGNLDFYAGAGIKGESSLPINGVTGITLQYNGTTQLTVGNGSISLPAGVNLTAAGSITSSGGGIGYAAGAGGTVAQGTSKSTAVILNKLCGDITTTADNMAAGALVSFTLTNSQISPTDTVIVRLRSGNATVGTYRVWAEGNQSGARTICIENRSGGALAETLVLGFEVFKGANS